MVAGESIKARLLRMQKTKSAKKETLQVPNIDVVGSALAREEGNNDNESGSGDGGDGAGGLTRKQLRRQVLSERLDRKLDALARIHAENDKQEQLQAEKMQQQTGDGDAAAAAAAGDDAGDAGDADADAGDAPAKKAESAGIGGGAKTRKVAAASAGVRKASLGGTFWKDRKEKAKRKLFVGGIPAGVHADGVKRLMATYGADSECEPIEIEVDILKPKNQQHARARKGDDVAANKNAYIVMPTEELMRRAASALDGVWVRPGNAIGGAIGSGVECTPMTDVEAQQWRRRGASKLRVNGAYDKDARAEAISKRKGGDGGRAVYKRRGGGFNRQHPSKM